MTEPASHRGGAVGLPDQVDTCLFDLDGVLVGTATVHAAAWKQMFDAYLAKRAGLARAPKPFDVVEDYQRYVDGRTREDGVRAFLASRSITIPEGSADDPAGAPTVRGLSRAKDELFTATIKTKGVQVYADARTYLNAARTSGMRIAVVSSSRHTRMVLTVSGLLSSIDQIVDGNVAADESLHGKPAPDTFLRAADLLGASPASSAVFEDSLAGVEAGRAGHFGAVVGVDRVRHGDELSAHGADIVVRELVDLLPRR